MGEPDKGVPRVVAVLSSPAGLRQLRRAAVALVVLGLIGFLVEGANRPANPYLSPTRTLPANGPGGTAFGLGPPQAGPPLLSPFPSR